MALNYGNHSHNNSNILSGVLQDQYFCSSTGLYGFPNLTPAACAPTTTTTTSQFSGYGQSFGLLDDNYSTVPSLCANVASNNIQGTTNNELLTAQVPRASSTVEEELEDEEGNYILSNLPNSCDDFAEKEKNIKMVRNLSNSMMADQISPDRSVRLGSGCTSAEPMEVFDSEDLEVAFINESFAEQTEHSRLYKSGKLATLFYGSNQSSPCSKTGTTRSSTAQSVHSSVERPPYAKKFCKGTTERIETPRTPCLPVPKEESPSLAATPKSNTHGIELRPARPEPAEQTPPDETSPVAWAGGGSASILETLPSYNIFGEAPSSRSEPSKSFSVEALSDFEIDIPSCSCTDWTPQAQTSKETPKSQEEFSKRSALLAQEIVESLFTSTCDSLEMDQPGPSKEPEKPKQEDDDGIGDSWEDVDDETLSKQLEDIKLNIEAKSKPKRPVEVFQPVAIDGLEHVMEVYDLPSDKTKDDISEALLTLDSGNATVFQSPTNKLFLISFANKRQALEINVVHKHPWLRLRPLQYSSANVQKIAVGHKSQLLPTRARPTVYVGVARSLVEGALGQRTDISAEKRREERKILKDARESKRAVAKNWD